MQQTHETFGLPRWPGASWPDGNAMKQVGAWLSNGRYSLVRALKTASTHPPITRIQLHASA
eukprot:143312-Pleurochrysis_carterae.AAC.1